jgi:hypothetical protein
MVMGRGEECRTYWGQESRDTDRGDERGRQTGARNAWILARESRVDREKESTDTGRGEERREADMGE